MHTALIEMLNDLEEMADGSGQAVEAHDYDNIASAEVAQELGENRTRALGARSVLLVDGGAAGCLEFVDLGVVELVLGRNAGMADETVRGR